MISFENPQTQGSHVLESSAVNLAIDLRKIHSVFCWFDTKLK